MTWTGQPRYLVMEEGTEGEPLARAMLRSFPKTPRLMIPPGEREPLRPGRWVIRRHKGRFLKPCPGTRRYLCCGYRVFNLVLGCPHQCAYCILKDYLDGEAITVMVNLDDALGEVRAHATRSGITRIGTGELADSLALEPWIPLSERLVPFFRDLPGAMLELKTKSTQVEALMDLPHGGHTVISWSLSPRSMLGRFEPGTPPLESRLAAASQCQAWGYPIGLHFDPMIWTEDWEDEYREMIQEVFGSLDPRGVLWISLGGLRYPPALHERLLPSGLGLGELLPGLDGKRRYLRPIRTRMFSAMHRWIRERSPEAFVYLCMESPEVWRGSLGWAPRDAAELDGRFQQRILSFWSRS